MITEFIPTDERTTARFPLILTTGRILSQYNVGAQTRRTANVLWHEEDVLMIHVLDAENRGIPDGDLVSVASRAGETTLHARISERMQPGVVYTTFHHPESGANVVTTEFSDWATSCPEYKVTAVQAGRLDLLSAVYLPYCDRFVTCDPGQYNALKALTARAGLPAKVMTYSSFRESWLIAAA